MIVDQAGGLHERVTDRRADEPKLSFLELVRQRIRFARARRHAAKRAPAVDLRRAADEAPDEAIEAANLALQLEKRARIAHRARDLEPVAHNAGVGEQAI